jgi:hypothetical protein
MARCSIAETVRAYNPERYAIFHIAGTGVADRLLVSSLAGGVQAGHAHPGAFMAHTAFVHTYPSKPLAPEIHPVEALESPILKEVLGAWRQLPQTGGLPHKPVAILAAIKPHIKRLHLSDVIDDGADFRFKIVGEAVFSGLGESMRGRLVSQHPDPGIALRFSKLMAATLAAAAPIRGISIRLTTMKSHDYRIESLWLPFGAQARVSGAQARVREIMGLSTFMPLN